MVTWGRALTAGVVGAELLSAGLNLRRGRWLRATGHLGFGAATAWSLLHTRRLRTAGRAGSA